MSTDHPAIRHFITRNLAKKLVRASKQWPSITLTGPRQSGKSILCKHLFKHLPYKSLENSNERTFALDDPRGFLKELKGGAIIDEVQRAPELLSYLQGIIDQDPSPGKWILTGSQNFSLVASITQSLAGRTAMFKLLPLSRDEVRRFDDHPQSLYESMYKGSFPRLHNDNIEASDWGNNYIETYLERDVRNLDQIINLSDFQKFLRLCAARTSSTLNYSSLANDSDLSEKTIKSWLSILEASYMIFFLRPMLTNIRKRLVKMPKIHFMDTGIVCQLLGIRDEDDLAHHPLKGEIFETWVASEVVKAKANLGQPLNMYYYRDTEGKESDLVLEGPHPHVALIEAKISSTASNELLKGARKVMEELKGKHTSTIFTVYGGDDKQTRGDHQTIVPWESLHTLDFDRWR